MRNCARLGTAGHGIRNQRLRHIIVPRAKERNGFRRVSKEKSSQKISLTMRYAPRIIQVHGIKRVLLPHTTVPHVKLPCLRLHPHKRRQSADHLHLLQLLLPPTPTPTPSPTPTPTPVTVTVTVTGQSQTQTQTVTQGQPVAPTVAKVEPIKTLPKTGMSSILPLFFGAPLALGLKLIRFKK